MNVAIKPKERSAIITSLQAGVIPRIGLHHLQVGRKEELTAVLKDFERIAQGGAAVRFVVGRYGAGKSFFLNLCRMVALEQKLIVVQADLTTDRRLHGSAGQARGLYAELLRNLCIRSKPDGGALASVVERWIADAQHEVRAAGGQDEDVIREIHKRLAPLQELVSGYDYSTVLGAYMKGYLDRKDEMTQAALRWLRGEYTTKTEARQDLGVRSIIDDETMYDHLKLLAAFVRQAGYKGLLVCVDEMGVLSHRLNHSKARDANYEAILRIVNDCFQGLASGIGFYFAGIDEFLEDKRRGLYSYEALRSRLADGAISHATLKDFSGPVLRLGNLTQEELYVLLQKIRGIFASADSARLLVPDEALPAYMQRCSQTLGSTYFQTPREVVRGFVKLLAILEQNPGSDWKTILPDVAIDREVDPDRERVGTPASPSVEAAPADDDLKEFRL